MHGLLKRRAELIAWAVVLLLTPLVAFANEPTVGQAPQQTPPTAATGAASADEADIKKRLIEVALVARRDGKVAALGYTLETLKRAERAFGPNHGYVGAASRHAGALLYQLKRYPESARAYLRALVVASQFFAIGHDQYREAVANVAASWTAAGAPDQVIALYEDILKAPAAKDGDTFDASYFRLKLGALLRQRGRFAEAERHVRGVIATREREKGAEDRSVGFALVELGGLLRVMGRFTEAESTYLRVLATLRRHEGAEAPNVGIVFDNLGYVYNELGRRGDAERLHRQALAIFEAKLGPDHLTTATGFFNLATLYYGQGRDDEARRLYDRALAVYVRRLPPNDPRIGVLLDQYAGLERNARRYKEARVLYARALANLTAVHGAEHPETAKVMNNMALAEQALGNHAEAERLLRAAIAAQEKAFGPSHYLVGAGLSNLGDVLLARGQLAPALTALMRGIGIIESAVGPEHPALVTPLRILAGVSAGLGRYDDALGYARRAISVALADARRGRLDLENARDTSQAAGALRGALDVFWRAREAMPDRAVVLATETFETAQWLTQTAAGRTLVSISTRLAARDPAIAALVRRRQDLGRAWTRANEKLLVAVARPREKSDAALAENLRSELGRIEAEIKERENEIKDAFPDFDHLSDPKPLAIEAVRKLLGRDEALVQFVGLGADSYAWVVTRDELAWRQLAMPTRDIDRLVHRLRCGLDSGEWTGESKSLRCLDLLGEAPDDKGLLPFDAHAAAALYDVLLRPFEATLGRHRLLIVASGPLARLPFQTLVVKAPAVGRPGTETRGLEWLVRHRATSVLPSVASLAVLKSREAVSKARKPYLAVSNPLLTGRDGSDRRAFAIKACKDAEPATLVASARPATGAAAIVVRGGVADAASVRALAPLPETAAEVCRVARRLGTGESSVLIGASAREAELRRLNDEGRLADYRLLHFATHGLVSGELNGLTEPALVLTPPETGTPGDDGLLTASEVAGLKLDADWVVLSACNTGAAEGEGGEALSGLANAFFHAGARSLLVSHWPVQSEAAVGLVTRAIAELGRGRGGTRSKSEALRRAMLAMIDAAGNEVAAHPQTWAPFVVVGETATRAIVRNRPRSQPSSAAPAPSAGGDGWVARAFRAPL
ncbi:MAG: CHAT domain-containing tetratricopeptide repeat protein [Hyphomicrobiaceae bacterium]